jgi:chromosomal replication initiator protein
MNFWQDVLSIIEKRTNRHCFETWFRPIVFQGTQNGKLHLLVPTESFKNCLLENYSRQLLDSAAEIGRASLSLEISVESLSETGSPPPPPSVVEKPASSPALIPKYTFDSFVVGTSNQLARAAAIAVAERPSKAYNPLYLYGGVGLGKTHLMHAIGNLILERNRGIRLTYMSSENFMNELVNAIRYDRTIQFRQRYRTIDVLLMDDIQFLAGKERTQEEFFHTFNALYDAQKQIVITSDCPPKQIPTLEERLHSRFQWGLIADIQAPDLETKLAILTKKAESFNLQNDVLMFIARGIRSNVRELEGALNRLSARASLDGLDSAAIDISYAREVLKGFASTDAPQVSPEAILGAVASFFHLKPAQLKAKNNAPSVAVPRQIAMYILKELTHQSLPQIGREFGGKHHTTVLHSIRKISSLKKKDAHLSKAVNAIVKSLN